MNWNSLELPDNPYYQDDAVVIYHADCREILPHLPKVDLVLTDPPYGVREDDWDNMSALEFARFSMGWISEVRRLSENMLVFCTSDNAVRQLCEMIYSRIRQIIWSKPMGSQYNGSSEARLWYAHEVILHCHNGIEWAKPKTLAFAELLKGAREAAGLSRGAVDMVIRGKKTGLCYRWEEAACIPTPEQLIKLKELLKLDDTFEQAIERATADKAVTADKADVLVHRTIPNPLHPTQKPEGLICDLLLTVGRENQTVLDPFLGSGTTAYCAKKLNRKCIGIEIEEKYCEIAAKRCCQTVMNFLPNGEGE